MAKPESEDRQATEVGGDGDPDVVGQHRRPIDEDGHRAGALALGHPRQRLGPGLDQGAGGFRLGVVVVLEPARPTREQLGLRRQFELRELGEGDIHGGPLVVARDAHGGEQPGDRRAHGRCPRQLQPGARIVPAQVRPHRDGGWAWEAQRFLRQIAVAAGSIRLR